MEFSKENILQDFAVQIVESLERVPEIEEKLRRAHEAKDNKAIYDYKAQLIIERSQRVALREAAHRYGVMQDLEALVHDVTQEREREIGS